MTMSPIMLYGTSLALLIDLYELTMVAGFLKAGIVDRHAVFQISFRRRPFEGEFAITAGLEMATQLIDRFRFDGSDIAYLKTLKGIDGGPLFEEDFFTYLTHFKFSCDIDAMPEGTVVFPGEPMIRVKGPIGEAQLLETLLLNVINFQSLIATKAARICAAAHPDEVIEFGIRRAQGIDGGLSASRAAFIGGCSSTSHVLAGKFYGIPVKGTHAHSWVMAFADEEIAFRTWAQAMPNNCIFLVDTYKTAKGVERAIKVAKEVAREGVALTAIRLDSGDITQLSVEIRKMLNEAGLNHVKIMASNELDEFIIRDLKQQGAAVSIWGVGTHLVTGKGQPALDGVYKLSAIQDTHGKWQYRIKISDQIAKVTNPGIPQVRRFFDHKANQFDMIYDELIGIPQNGISIDLTDPTKEKKIHGSMLFEDLLKPIYRKGMKVYTHPPLQDIQKKVKEGLEKFPASVKRFLNPSPYFVGMEKRLHEFKVSIMRELEEIS